MKVRVYCVSGMGTESPPLKSALHAMGATAAEYGSLLL